MLVQQLSPEQLELVEGHVRIARRIGWTLPIPLGGDREEAISKALEALVILAREWEPERGVPFGAFVNSYLRSRVFDLVRTEMGRHGKKVDPKALHLDAGIRTANGVDLLETLADPDGGPEAAVLSLDEEGDAEALWAAVEGLPPRQRFVVSARYRTGLTLGVIGALLGVTESRVCQINAAAMRALRSQVREQWRPA